MHDTEGGPQRVPLGNCRSGRARTHLNQSLSENDGRENGRTSENVEMGISRKSRSSTVGGGGGRPTLRLASAAARRAARLTRPGDCRALVSSDHDNRPSPLASTARNTAGRERAPIRAVVCKRRAADAGGGRRHATTSSANVGSESREALRMVGSKEIGERPLSASAREVRSSSATSSSTGGPATSTVAAVVASTASTAASPASCSPTAFAVCRAAIAAASPKDARASTSSCRRKVTAEATREDWR